MIKIEEIKKSNFTKARFGFLILSLLIMPRVANAEYEAPTSYNVSILSVLIGPTKADGKKWDATFNFGKAASGALSSLPVSGIIPAPAINALIKGAPSGSAAPEVYGTIKHIGPTTAGLAAIAGTPLALRKRSNVIKNTYTPEFNTEYLAWPMFKDTRFRIKLWDKDIKDDDPIGTVELVEKDIKLAVKIGKPIWIKVNEQSRNQVLFVQISASKALEHAPPKMIGTPYY
ncbi:MAG: hypothetical protein CME64_08935 [Halobacteriovoraceae bacterium]|nr:hypothetical protein [Halobacteriovoraceae bacterium]|tara:strand:+ start:320564 stop:321253 length:690 start_codon:yes stop_codon:yes gene_type:complete